MDFQLNDDRRMLSETLERFLRDNYPIDKRHEITSGDKGWSPEMWSQFAELGVIGALFKEAEGGFGGEGADLMVVFEALGRALVVEPFLPTLLAGSVMTEAMGEAANEHLEAVINGEKLIAFAHGEPNSRYHLDHVECVGEENSGWKLTGHKAVVLGAADADLLVVSARTSGSVDEGVGISLFLVDPKSDGVTIRNYGTVDGYPAADIILDGAPGELIGEAGAALPAIEKAHATAMLAASAEALGAMEIAKDLTVEYMHTRKQFGVIIGKFQALQHRMVDMQTELEQATSMAILAATFADGEDNDERSRIIAAAKYICARAARKVAEEAIQLHGGIGMTWEYNLAHHAKRLVMIAHQFGDDDHHLKAYAKLMQVA